MIPQLFLNQTLNFMNFMNFMNFRLIIGTSLAMELTKKKIPS